MAVKIDLKDLEGALEQIVAAGKAAKIELVISDVDADGDMDVAILKDGQELGHVELSKVVGWLKRAGRAVVAEVKRIPKNLRKLRGKAKKK